MDYTLLFEFYIFVKNIFFLILFNSLIIFVLLKICKVLLMISFFSLILIFLFIYIFFNFFSFLRSLLLLEACSLILFFFSVYLIVFGFSIKFLLYYFVFIVSERAIGLSILVITIKTFGSGNFRSINISKL